MGYHGETKVKPMKIPKNPPLGQMGNLDSKFCILISQESALITFFKLQRMMGNDGLSKMAYAKFPKTLNCFDILKN